MRRMAILLGLCLSACQLPDSGGGQLVDVAGTELDVFTYRPPDCKLQVILLVFDGQNRHGWAARNQSEFLAKRFCGFVVAPQLEETRFPHNDMYEYGGLTRSPGHRTIDLVPPLAAWARAAVSAPRLPFVLLGHSSGGQFVSRAAAFSSTGAAGIVVANPSTWVLPSTTIASPFGLGRTEAATDDGLRAYLAQPITVLAGTNDTNGMELAVTPPAMAQGANRYARALRTFHMAEDVARSHGWPFGWTLGEVQGVGHSASRMYSSDQAVAAIQRALESAAEKQ